MQENTQKNNVIVISNDQSATFPTILSGVLLFSCCAFLFYLNLKRNQNPDKKRKHKQTKQTEDISERTLIHIPAEHDIINNKVALSTITLSDDTATHPRKITHSQKRSHPQHINMVNIEQKNIKRKQIRHRRKTSSLIQNTRKSTDLFDGNVQIRCYINKHYERTQHLDITQDVWHFVELKKHNVTFNKLQSEIMRAFQREKVFKALFKNTEKYNWRIFSYFTENAQIEIEDDDDLLTEIEVFLSCSEDKEYRTKRGEECLNVRVIFFCEESDDEQHSSNDNNSVKIVQIEGTKGMTSRRKRHRTKGSILRGARGELDHMIKDMEALINYD